MAKPTNHPKLPPVKTTLQVFARTYLPLATLHRAAKSLNSTRAGWSRCTKPATDKVTQATPTRHMGKANRCTNNVLLHRRRPKYMLTLG